MEDKVKVEAVEEVEVKCEPPVEVDCLLDYNLGTQLTVEQEVQIADGPPCLGYDGGFLSRKTPKPRQRRASGQRNYNCARCGKDFLRCSDLVKHEKTHTEERLYACSICGKSFRRHTSLLIHERIHTGERPYQCTQCGKSFVQRQHLTTHLRTHTGEKPFQCIECGKGFRWRSELLKHQKIHTEKSGVGFDDLAASFSKEEWMELEEWQKELYRNVMKETSETLISLGEGLVEKTIGEKPPEELELAPSLAADCGSNLPLGPEEVVVCGNSLAGEDGPLGQTPDIAEGKAFTDGVDKIRLKFLDHTNGSSSARAHACAECGSVFYNKRTLKAHLRSHLGERSYICNVCGKCFRRHTSLLIHERIHTGERPYQCTQCGKSFVQRQHLNTHLKTHTGEKPFQCGQCPKGFRWRSELAKHQKIHEEEQGLLSMADPTCKMEKENFLDDDWRAITSAQTQQSRKLNSQACEKVLGRTAQEALHPCTQCDKTFLRSSDLARHQRTHLGERPYVCNQCGKCFRRNTSLLIHERIHTGERPYQCAQCGKSFIQRQHLTTHLKTHTGEKPFPCTLCGKSYRWRSELLKHQRVHSNEAAVTFDDVAVCFSDDWKDLEEWQKELYRNMMKESADSLVSLGEVWIGKNGKELSPEKPVEELEMSSDCKDPLRLGAEAVCEVRDFPGDEPHSSADVLPGFRPGLPFLEQRPLQREKLFSCNQCDKRFARSSDLLKHQRSHQGGDKANLCNDCGKIFRRRTALLIHKRIHTGERPYKCKQCGKCFVQRQHLTTHVKTHTGERPYPCTECGKSYRWRSELNKHQKVHADVLSSAMEYTQG